MLKNSSNFHLDKSRGPFQVVTSDKEVFTNFQPMNGYVTEVVFSSIADGDVENSSSETSISGVGLGTRTLPASFLEQAKSITIEARGVYSSVSNPTMRIRNKLGSTTITDTTAFTLSTATNGSWKMVTNLDCRSVGATGSISGSTEFCFNSALATSSRIDVVNVSATTVDTTVALLVSTTAQWGTASASNTLTCTSYKIRIEI